MAKMPISNVVILCGMLVMTRCLGQREELDFPILHSPPSADDFLNMYMEPRIPFVLKNGLRDWPATTLWGSWEKLGNDIGDVVVRVGRGPYPNENSTLSSYLETCPVDSTDEEMSVVFQYGNVPVSWSLDENSCEAQGQVMGFSLPLHDNVATACKILSRVRVPSFISGHAPILHAGLLVGYTGNAIGFHRHACAVNGLVVGEKHWVIQSKTRRYSGVQLAGDLVFIPRDLEHAVNNTKPSIAFQMQWDEIYWDNFDSITAMMERMI
mmetsp:Transcript_26954/g.43383  ORF Transcript_26954/g.43383 Transcript_26954/m.43383 type:complete len:267 (-) Transcript_26954:894-1694(-)